MLLILALVFVILGLGLAFTLCGEITLLLAVVSAVYGTVSLSRTKR